MMGSTALNSSTPSGSRMFRYEVRGLRQSPGTDNNDYPIRSSDSIFMTVPYNRMNDEMRRITRMGGEIVSIQPLEFDPEGSSNGQSEE
ncbi:MAG: phycobilisome linker polypeptide [Phormidium sp.]|nr:MAG: phycocyanin-associated rod-terminating linker protein CpcD [Phormidium sp. OSCR]